MALRRTELEGGVAQRARDALGAVRAAFIVACDSIDGLDGRRPIDFVNTLGIDMKLAWKASRLLRAVDPAEILNELPGRPGHKKLLKGMIAAGASVKAAEGFDSAVEALHAEIKNLAGSRSLFETMVIGFDGGKDTPLAVEQRRQFFNGARSVSGIQCDMSYRMDVLAPSAEKGYVDCATIRSCLGMVRFHPSAPWRIRIPTVRDDDGQNVGPTSHEPIDPDGSVEEDVPLIRSLCYGDEPRFTPISSSAETPEFTLNEEEIGMVSRRTITYGEVLRAAEPAGATASHHGFHQVMRLRTPSEWVVFDVLMHRDLLPASETAHGIIYSDLHGERFASTYRESDRMPINVRVETVEDYRDIQAPEKWKKGMFKEMLGLLVERTGWSLEDFRWQRLSLPYPPLPSSLVYEVELR